MIDHLNDHIEKYLEDSGLEAKYSLQIDRQQSSTRSRYAPSLLLPGLIGLPHIVMAGGEILDKIAGTSTVTTMMDFFFNEIIFSFTLYSYSSTQHISGKVFVDFEYNRDTQAFDFGVKGYRLDMDVITDYIYGDEENRYLGDISDIYSDPDFFKEDPATGLIFEGSIDVY